VEFRFLRAVFAEDGVRVIKPKNLKTFVGIRLREDWTAEPDAQLDAELDEAAAEAAAAR
jgi:hypothetical protein